MKSSLRFLSTCFLFLYLSLISGNILFAQSSKFDSLRQIIDSIPQPKEQLKFIATSIPEFDYIGQESDSLLALGFSIAKKTNDEFGRNRMTYIQAVAKYRAGEFDAADDLLKKCLEYYSIDNWAYLYLGVRSLQTILLRKKKEYFKSLHLTLSTISEAEQIIPNFETEGEFVKKDIVTNLSSLYNNAGNLYQEIDDLENAAIYMRKSADTDLELNEERAYGISLSNLGSILNDDGKYEEAKEVLEKAYEIKKKTKRKVSIALTEVNLAENAVYREDFKAALSYIDKCKPVFERVGYKEAIAVALVNEGRIWEGLENYQKAIKLYEEALIYIEEVGAAENREKVLFGLYQSYSKIGNPKKALAFHEAYVEELDNRKNTELIRQVALKQASWDYDNQLAVVQLENEKNDALAQTEIEKLANLRNSLIVGLLGLAAVLFLMYRAFQQKTKYSSELQEKNTIIEKSLSEKELLLKEIHHRVKNNLQVISSLLSLQSDYIEDDSALSAIQEGRDRVKSMAIIHQNLYQEDNLTGIEVRQYFEKLMRSLFNSYNIRPEQIKLELNVEDINLDVDTVIPLGLVVNELITNALKYAFPDNRPGQIKIDLKEANGQLILNVEDDGVGFDTSKIGQANHSFGYQIIEAFKDKLDAELTVDGVGGTKVRFAMREYELAG